MNRGAQTRDKILEQAVRLASVEGLQGLTIGRLAEDLSLSKSGLFAHFGSKEALQAEVVRTTVLQFKDLVLDPAAQVSEGTRRLREIYKLWTKWGDHESMPGGCLFNAIAAEVDDQPSPARDILEGWSRKLRLTLGEQVKAAIALGEMRADVDPAQFAFELGGIMLAMHRTKQLLRDRDNALKYGAAAFERLLTWTKV